MTSIKVKRHATVVLIIFGNIFSILSNAGNSWEYITHNGSYQLGLWKKCVFNSNIFKCASRERTGTLKATQTFMTFGCLGCLLALIFCAFLHLKKSLNMKLLGGILNTSAMCLLIGLSLYTNQVNAREYAFGWSYAIGWISVVFTLAAGLLCFSQSVNAFDSINADMVVYNKDHDYESNEGKRGYRKIKS